MPPKQPKRICWNIRLYRLSFQTWMWLRKIFSWLRNDKNNHLLLSKKLCFLWCKHRSYGFSNKLVRSLFTAKNIIFFLSYEWWLNLASQIAMFHGRKQTWVVISKWAEKLKYVWFYQPCTWTYHFTYFSSIGYRPNCITLTGVVLCTLEKLL